MAQYIGSLSDITSIIAGTNLNGGGTSGAITLNVDPVFGADGITIKDTTASSATEGGNLILASDDGAVMADNHRLGVIEFKGAEDTDNTLTNGARIQCIADATWSASENGASLQFYTTDGNASESVALTLDSDNLATFAGSINLDSVSISAIQTGSESFVDNDTSIMTSAAIQDKILAYGYSTAAGDITSVIGGTNCTVSGGASGDATVNVDDSFLINSGNDTTTGTITAAGFTTTGTLEATKRKMSVSSTTDGNVGSGDIIYFGTGSSVVGKIYHYKSDGSWELADANAAANCDGLLAVAIGTDPDVDGMLIRGMVTLIDIQGTEAVGDVLYLSESATGAADCVAPAGNLDIIRVIGYCLSTDDQVWFDPDKTFVEVTA